MDNMDFNNLNASNNDQGANNYESSNYAANNCGTNNDCDTNSIDKPDSLKASSFYTESYRKQGTKRNNGLIQLVIVALVSSIIGGAIVGGFYQFVTPVIQSSLKGYFEKLIPGQKVASSITAPKEDSYKRVEIVQNADSPVTAIAEKVGPAIVGIRVTPKEQTQDFGFFFGSQQGPSEGSGIIFKNDGYIMTNYHVIEGSLDSKTQKQTAGAKIEVYLPSQKDKPYDATIVGHDWRTDLAVLKIDATNLPAAELGNSDQVKVGEIAVAIGNPGGLEYMGSVTVGVISGMNRSVPVGDGKELKLIQTDASINPGNSGGALVNSKGQVIGVNTAKIVQQGFEGLGFAIPINKAKEIIDSLMEFKYVKGRPFLGITADTRFNEDMAKEYNVPVGVLVDSVTPLSGAYKAGIKTGDIITKFDEATVKSLDELNTLKNKRKSGDTVKVEIYRDGQTLTVDVKLTEDKGNVK